KPALRIRDIRAPLQREAVLVRADEPVHPSMIYVGYRRRIVVGTFPVAVAMTHLWPYARLEDRIGRARGGHTIVHRNTVSTRVRPEVLIERTVLLHDHHDMLDLVNTDRHTATRRRSARRKANDRDNERNTLVPTSSHTDREAPRTQPIDHDATACPL